MTPEDGHTRPTPHAFAAAAARTRLCEASKGAARLVLLEGCSLRVAASLFAIEHKQQVWDAVQAVRRELQRGGKCVVCGAPARDKQQDSEGGGCSHG